MEVQNLPAACPSSLSYWVVEQDSDLGSVLPLAFFSLLSFVLGILYPTYFQRAGVSLSRHWVGLQGPAKEGDDVFLLLARIACFPNHCLFSICFPDLPSLQSPLLPLFSFIAHDHSQPLVYILGDISSMALSQCNLGAGLCVHVTCGVWLDSQVRL